MAQATRAEGGPIKGAYKVMRGVGPGSSTESCGKGLDGLKSVDKGCGVGVPDTRAVVEFGKH